MSQLAPENLDVVKLLIKNFREDKPLLEGAVLFRGSRFGDQMGGPDSPTQMHAHLLPQVAASYTHNWQKGESFIDTYAIDRENTRFYANQSIEDRMKGGPTKSYGVEDVERWLRPMVENLAHLPSHGKAFDQQLENLERAIKSSFYEAAVPVRQPDGNETVPLAKFLYSGEPKAATAKEVFDRMERLTPENEMKAKEYYARARLTDASRELGKLETFHPEAAKAFKVMQQAVQRDQAAHVLAKHSDLPLSQFITATRNEPQSENHARVLKLAQGLAHHLDSQDVNVRARALAATEQIGKLDPNSATMKDVALQVAKVAQAGRSTENGGASAADNTRGFIPPKAAASVERGLSR
ncbi:TPA: hypothetical protein QDB04_000091 [Burkholderia vietnamiensis]|nr:hypothetical protein [Burkholderia vietnamiensis]